MTYQVRLKPIFVWTLHFATSKAWVGIKALVGVVVSLVFAVLSALYYAAHNFTVNTNVSGLIFSNLRWRQRELTYQNVFPKRLQSILVLLQASTTELAIRDVPFCCQ